MFTLIPAILIGKLIATLTRLFKFGGGSAAPGYYALKIDPSLVQKLSHSIPTQIIITGTNGKTTTSRLLSHLFRKNGVRIIHNSTGSNLERGIASALIQKSDLFGKIKHIKLAIWEVDEAAFNTVALKLNPTIIVFLNAFRDQLDRYGEVDTVVENWRKTLANLDKDCLLIVNGDDSHTGKLNESVPQNCIKYGVEGSKILGEYKRHHVANSQFDYLAQNIKLEGLKGSRFSILAPNAKISSIFLPLAGLYQIYNFLACLAVFHNLNLPLENLSTILNDFKTPFGRAELLHFNGKELSIMLIKNPIGATNVFQTISLELQQKSTLMFALNDNFADGTDVSWIWDAEFEELAKNASKNTLFIISGKRAYDLAVRFKYAGVDPEQLQVIPAIDTAFNVAVEQSAQKLYILPTYTALLELQKILTRKNIKSHYWREE